MMNTDRIDRVLAMLADLVAVSANIVYVLPPPETARLLAQLVAVDHATSPRTPEQLQDFTDTLYGIVAAFPQLRDFLPDLNDSYRGSLASAVQSAATTNTYVDERFIQIKNCVHQLSANIARGLESQPPEKSHASPDSAQ